MDNGKSQIKSGIVLNYLNTILGNLIPVFYTPIMLQILGQNEFGLYKLSSSVTSYLTLISMGIGSAVTRYLIKSREEDGKKAEEKMFGLFIIVFHVLAGVCLVIGTVLTINLNVFYGDSLTPDEINRMRILVFLMTCNTAVSFSMTPYISMVTSHERFLFYQSMNIVLTCGIPILNLIVLYLGYASIGMAVVSLGVSIITRVVYFLYVLKSLKYKPKYKEVPVNLLRDILRFSFWVFVSNVVGQLYNATDAVMIGMIPSLATAGVAVYSIGLTFNTIIGGISTGVSSLLTPRTNKMVFSGANGEELTDIAIRVGRIQGILFMLVMTGFIAFGRQFISFYAGEGYEDAYWVAITTTVPCVIFVVQSVCLSVIVAQNKHRFRAIVYLGIAIANIVGTWFLMQTSLGIIGAALMTGIATFIGQGLIMNWYYSSKTELNMKRFWKELFRPIIVSVPLCLITILLSCFINFFDITTLLIGIVCYTMVFFFIYWIFVMNDYEKSIIKKVIPRKKSVNQ